VTRQEWLYNIDMSKCKGCKIELEHKHDDEDQYIF